MSLNFLVISSFIIGLSGAMMPGPLLTYAVNASLQKGIVAGPLLVVGHGLLELILIISLFLGLNQLFAQELFTALIGIIGGIILLWMGYGMLKSALLKQVSIEDKTETKKKVTGLIIPGIFVSLSNPYWFLWWATIGMTYLVNSLEFGILGLSLFYFGHIMADFSWYSFVSFLVVGGKKLINDQIYRGLIIFFGLLLIYFALTFISQGFNYFF